jgi:hypothetical protein
MKIIKLISGLLFALILLSQWSCKKDKDPGFITLVFNHTVAGEALEFENIIYPARAGHIYSVIRLKYYVSNFNLHNANGSIVEVNKVHYRDAEMEETKSLSLGEIPYGDYNKISFIFGLDEETNVDGGLPNTQTNINMEWPIPGDQGYHYMKFEGKYDSLDMGVIKNFNLHTGATMGNQNYVEVSLPLSSFSVDGNSWKINLEMDLNEWLQNPNVYDFEEFGSLIMMNQTAQSVLKANGATVFSISSVLKE